MFGIGLPEMIVIFAVALIVVGPDKLPDLARSLAKGLIDMKRTLHQVKENLTQEDDALDSVQKDLRKTAEELREKVMDRDTATWRQLPPSSAAEEGGELIELQTAAEPAPDPAPPTPEQTDTAHPAAVAAAAPPVASTTTTPSQPGSGA